MNPQSAAIFAHQRIHECFGCLPNVGLLMQVAEGFVRGQIVWMRQRGNDIECRTFAAV